MCSVHIKRTRTYYPLLHSQAKKACTRFGHWDRWYADVSVRLSRLLFSLFIKFFFLSFFSPFFHHLFLILHTHNRTQIYACFSSFGLYGCEGIYYIFLVCMRRPLKSGKLSVLTFNSFYGISKESLLRYYFPSNIQPATGDSGRNEATSTNYVDLLWARLSETVNLVR